MAKQNTGGSEVKDYRARLIATRIRAGLSLTKMAEALWTPRVTYTQWEDGSRRVPGIAVRAAELLFPVPLNTPREGTVTNRIWLLADGSLTTTEIASCVGKPRNNTLALINQLRKRGLVAKVKEE